MKSWRAPELVALPGSGQIPVLHDQASGEPRPSALPHSAMGRSARLYVCGITPYDSTHIGHTATYIAFDLLGRAWRDAGLDVNYVQNVTDIDDPLLERANDTGEDWRALADRQIALFQEDLTALRVLPPQQYVGATEAIDLVATAIDGLREKGAIYRVDDDLYFEVAKDPGFGKVSGWSSAQMLDVFAERGGDPARKGKRDKFDCLVWLAQRPGEPGWSPDVPGIPTGRPGWHIECTAIALEHLGMGFDVQGGGSDLIFPHHEMCASEGEVLESTSPFARVYAYQGMVGLDGEKMSKSKGNLVFSSGLRRDGTDPMAIRLAVLGHHYRDDWEWTPEDLRAAERRLDRWCAATKLPAGAAGAKVLDGVREALAADLDAPGALQVVDDWADATLAGEDSDSGAPGLVADVCDTLLGVRLTG